LYCFWDIETSGQDWSDGGTGLTTAQMQNQNTFIDAGWDFVGQPDGPSDIWAEPLGGGYPILWWQLSPLPPLPTFSGGSGIADDPYLISNANDLNHIGYNPRLMSAHFKLISDIDLIGVGVYIIGSQLFPFTGGFDGNGNTISNFTYASTCAYFIGLFGHIDSSTAEIKDLGLIDPNVDVGTGDYVGSLVGWLREGAITGCYVEGGSVSGDIAVGGLVGDNYGGKITISYSNAHVSGRYIVGGLVGGGYNIVNCYATGNVSGDHEVGGLVGSGGDILNCYSTTSVSGDDYVGGLVGENRGTITYCYSTSSVEGVENIGGVAGYNRSTISNCYSTGSVEGAENVGGLVGRNGSCYKTRCFPGMITNCYSAGSVVGSEKVGVLVGWNHSGVYTSSFWDNTVNPMLPGIGNAVDPNVIGESTANMQTESTFTDADWDFVGETFNGIEDIWFIPQADYPRLWWEGMQVPIKLTPRILNCRSEGNWVKAHLTLPQGFTIADVDTERPAVLYSFGFQSAPLYVFINKDKLVEIEAAFKREQVCSMVGNWPEKLTVAGFLTNGSIFLGTSTVRIIHPGMKVIDELASCWLQEDCIYPETDMNRDSLVNLLDYALLMNTNVEFVSNE